MPGSTWVWATCLFWRMLQYTKTRTLMAMFVKNSKELWADSRQHEHRLYLCAEEGPGGPQRLPRRGWWSQHSRNSGSSLWSGSAAAAGFSTWHARAQLKSQEEKRVELQMMSFYLRNWVRFLQVYQMPGCIH